MSRDQTVIIPFSVDKQLNKNRNDQELHEIELIGRLRDLDETALEELYHDYYSRLFRFIARIIRRDDLIDEIINDVMFIVWEKASTYNGQCKLSTWIFGIAFNKARQTLRNATQTDDESLDDIDEDSRWLGTPDRDLQQLETDDWLNYALNALSPEHRAVVELTYYEGLHYSEIAMIMDCPENTVKTRMHHARKNMAVFLTPFKESLKLGGGYHD